MSQLSTTNSLNDHELSIILRLLELALEDMENTGLPPLSIQFYEHLKLHEKVKKMVSDKCLKKDIKSMVHELINGTDDELKSDNVMKKYHVVGGYIVSKNDYEKHYIEPQQLIELYGVDPNDCSFTEGRIMLKPRYGGDYKEHLKFLNKNDQLKEVLIDSFGLKCIYSSCRSNTHKVNHDFCQIHKRILNSIETLEQQSW